MTTTVKVSAHCEHDKQVQISYSDENGLQQQTIQDGEEFEMVVYDDKTCTVQEVAKQSV